MKFLVDESAGNSIVNLLRSLGHDVLSIAENYSGIDDTEVLSIAFKEDRVLITNDKDFGELVYRFSLPHKGVILLRLQDESASNRIEVVHSLLQNYIDRVADNFIIASEDKIRIRYK